MDDELMVRKLPITAIGQENFEKIIINNYFYIDKTSFIKEWWKGGDEVTLITRPRRFGKTLTMSMVEYFFSNKYQNKGKLFENFSIWNDTYYQELQGTYPVINLTFSSIKEDTFDGAKTKFYNILINLYNQHNYLLEGDFLSETEKLLFTAIRPDMKEAVATDAIYQLSLFLYRYYEKRVIILLDEYDTPMQEAYVGGYWDKMVRFMRSLFGVTFKSNPYLERAIMTGITRISKESIFSDLNNLEVVSTTSDKYATTFGFTEEEVFQALDEYNLSEVKEKTKEWYNGFVFGQHSDIYNPWSIINLLGKRKHANYWVNTSANTLIKNLLQKSNRKVKEKFEQLLKGEVIQEVLDEQIVFNQLDINSSAIWSLLLASGYLKVLRVEDTEDDFLYILKLTNQEVRRMFQSMVYEWFKSVEEEYNDFVKALLSNNVKYMNKFMNRISLETFSSFDGGNRPSTKTEPERFYHGFVLGLLIELRSRYSITSNRESGYGRYDVMLKPFNKMENAYIFEFKVLDPDEESSLQETVQAALKQIEEKQYIVTLKTEDYTNIHTYGFAFRGKEVLIEKGLHRI